MLWEDPRSCAHTSSNLALFRCSSKEWPVVCFSRCASHESEKPRFRATAGRVMSESRACPRIYASTAFTFRSSLSWCRPGTCGFRTSFTTPTNSRRSASVRGRRTPARFTSSSSERPAAESPSPQSTERAASITIFIHARSITMAPFRGDSAWHPVRKVPSLQPPSQSNQRQRVGRGRFLALTVTRSGKAQFPDDHLSARMASVAVLKAVARAELHAQDRNAHVASSEWPCNRFGPPLILSVQSSAITRASEYGPSHREATK